MKPRARASHVSLTIAVVGFFVSVFAVFGQAQVSFVLDHDLPIAPEALAGFQKAADRWSSILKDPITVTLNISYGDLPAGVLASTLPVEGLVDYTSFRNALAQDRSSSADSSAVASLSSGSSFRSLINRTSDDPHGSGSSMPFLDDQPSAHNSAIRLTLANARAIGLFAASGGPADADITFNSDFPYDFDPSNGIDTGKLDFVGIVTHEIGHALGFDSGVDVLDFNSPPTGGTFSSNDFTWVSPLDLFRYSTESRSFGPGVIDWSADWRGKYFSIDGGDHSLAYFSSGMINGDGNQASHWVDDMNIGIMDPTTAPGELLRISPVDLTAFDVIGYNLSTPIPEPSTVMWATAGLSGFALLARRRARDRKKV